MALIEIRNLRHVYRAGTAEAVMALDGISLTVGRGEFVAIVGGNGSGKSTLAKNLNALLLPTDGEVVVDGMNTRDRAVLWEIRQRVGMVFQNPDNQLVATVVEEDVAFGPENLGLPSAEVFSRVEELERFRLVLPPIPALAHRLRRDGLPIPEGILFVEELAGALTRLVAEGAGRGRAGDGAH